MKYNIQLILVLVFAVVLAVVLGTSIGTESYVELSVYFVIAFVLWYLAAGWRYAWQIAALMLISRCNVYQGFRIEGHHLFAMMVVVSSGIALLIHRSGGGRSATCQQAGLTELRWGCGLLMAYLGFHFVYNYMVPYAPAEYSLQNSLKAYFLTGSAFGLMFWLSFPFYRFHLGPGWSRTLVWITILAVFANVGVVAAMTLRGYGVITGGASGSPDAAGIFVNIPVINLTLNHHAMRTLAPEGAMLLSLLLLNRAWKNATGRWLRFAMWLALLGCLAGAVLAGGRATLVTCFLMVGAALIRQGRHFAVVAAAFAALLLVAVVNLFAEQVNQNLPLYMSRSLQVVMFERGYAYQTIESSNLSRESAREAAFKEWRSNDRVFFTGRSVYRHLGEDYYFKLRGQVGDAEAFTEYASRAGFVHNLVADLLVQYGLLGLIFYLLAEVCVIWYFWRLERKSRAAGMPVACTNLAFFGWFTTLFWLIQHLLAGGYLSSMAPLILGILRARYAQIEHDTTQQTDLKQLALRMD